MRIVVVGAGYVGLVTAACFAELGFEVVCIESNKQKLDLIRSNIMPIFEPGLEELIARNQLENRLSFSSDLVNVVNNCEIIFITVGTPNIENSYEVNLEYIHSAVDCILSNIIYDKTTTIVIKSTVPVGTNKRLQQKASFKKCEIISNPEFLREGFAIYDFMNPDRVVIGSDYQGSNNLMKNLYKNFTNRNIPVFFTSSTSAELIKYASNAFLATKIAFINQISDLCEKIDADVEEVACGMGFDSRIGSKFLKPGPGYGGSCFPKDIASLSNLFKSYGLEKRIIDSVILANQDRKKMLTLRIEKILGDLSGKTIAFLGLAFKNNTDDIRESPAIEIIKNIYRPDINIKIYDPKAMNNSRELLYHNNIKYCMNEYEAARGSDALIILTEWEDFAKLDLNRMDTKLIIDYRNILDKENIPSGVEYYCLGRLI